MTTFAPPQSPDLCYGTEFAEADAAYLLRVLIDGTPVVLSPFEAYVVLRYSSFQRPGDPGWRGWRNQARSLARTAIGRDS